MTELTRSRSDAIAAAVASNWVDDEIEGVAEDRNRMDYACGGGLVGLREDEKDCMWQTAARAAENLGGRFFHVVMRGWLLDQEKLQKLSFLWPWWETAARECWELQSTEYMEHMLVMIVGPSSLVGPPWRGGPWTDP